LGKEKFPKPSEIPWGKIAELRVSSADNSYSFEFDLHGKKQKMTISMAPNSTSFTLSTDDGSPIVHATQKGQEIRIVDFSSKLSLKGESKKLRKIKPVRKQ